MRGKKKKSTKELETELEQFIVNTGRSKDDIHTGYNDYCALKWRIDNPDSRRYDDDIRRMKDLHDVYLLGKSICNRQKRINASRKSTVDLAVDRARLAILDGATSNVMNTSISSSASTSINANEITASFESTPSPSTDPSTNTSSHLPSSNDETSRASLDINSLSDQSSILASHSINEITASFEANASFALSSTSRSNASDSSMVGTQSSKRPWLASQQSDAVVVVDLSNESSMIWKPHEQLLSSNASIMDVPSDGNCLFYACISKLQNCSTFTIEQASNMRKYVMDYLLLHASNPSGDSMILTWHTLAMMHASEIQSELRHKGFF
jgi:hypothetical protein